MSRQKPSKYQIRMYLRKPSLTSIHDPVVYTNIHRIREARGLCKQLFDSHLEMLIKHDLIPWNGDEVFIRGGDNSTDIFEMRFFENGEQTYHWWLDIEDITEA